MNKNKPSSIILLRSNSICAILEAAWSAASKILVSLFCKNNANTGTRDSSHRSGIRLGSRSNDKITFATNNFCYEFTHICHIGHGQNLRRYNEPATGECSTILIPWVLLEHHLQLQFLGIWDMPTDCILLDRPLISHSRICSTPDKTKVNLIWKTSKRQKGFDHQRK